MKILVTHLAGCLGWASDWVHVVEVGVWVQRSVDPPELWLSLRGNFCGLSARCDLNLSGRGREVLMQAPPSSGHALHSPIPLLSQALAQILSGRKWSGDPWMPKVQISATIKAAAQFFILTPPHEHPDSLYHICWLDIVLIPSWPIRTY